MDSALWRTLHAAIHVSLQRVPRHLGVLVTHGRSCRDLRFAVTLALPAAVLGPVDSPP